MKILLVAIVLLSCTKSHPPTRGKYEKINIRVRCIYNDGSLDSSKIAGLIFAIESYEPH
jgi:hypothetical protein